MSSVYEEIKRLETAKSDIETAIETCGVNVPDDELINAYASYISQIPLAVFSGLNAGPFGNSPNSFIRTIEQKDGKIIATPGGLVSSSESGLVPKIGSEAAGIITSSTDEWVLTSNNGSEPTWRKLPTNVFNSTTYTYTVVVGGDSNTYYPVRIDSTSDKTSRNQISVWKNLGSQTASYSGNHPNGTSSLWLQYEGRYTGWDGNGGYYRTWYKSLPYATLVSHAIGAPNGVGDLIVWLRGGGTEYKVSTTYKSEVIVYLQSINLGSDTYPYVVDPRTNIGNAGIIDSIFYGNASSADKWKNKITLTIGSTGKSVDGSGNVSWSLAEIGASTLGHNHDNRYLRWSNALADTNAMTWGTLTAAKGYTILSHASSSDGGDMGWAYKNGQISYLIDGYFYLNEGKYKLTDVTETVTNLSTSENYLTWTKNGAINNITIPYATKANAASLALLLQSRGKMTGNFLTGSSKLSDSGLSLVEAHAYYVTNGPANYGNILLIKGKDFQGCSELFLEWTGSTAPGNLYYRSLRDVTGTDWSLWTTLLSSANYNSWVPSKTGAGASGDWGINITGNAATATKLQTARTIWGQSFDGTKNISGDMTDVGIINTIFNLKTQSGNASLYLETVTATTDYAHLFVNNKNNDKSNKSRPLVLQNGYGNVGIGIANPTQKLEVNGNIKATSFIGNLNGNATTASYLPTAHGGDKPDPQYYFNYNVGVKVAMTRYANIGGTSSWFDTLWINGYAGGDVPNMVALTTIRNGTPRAFLSAQSNRSNTYGTYYEIISSYNIGSQSVNYATSSGIARSLGTDDTMKLYALIGNEINFGGTDSSNTIYFGYRAKDSKPIPTNFVFGGGDGSATLKANGFSKKGSSNSYMLLGGGGHKAISDIAVPVGTILMWPSDTLPNNYMLCDGSSLNKYTYSALFNVLGTTYGSSGDNFNLPNLKGKFIVGKDTNVTDYNGLAKTGGKDKVTLYISNMPKHNHNYAGSTTDYLMTTHGGGAHSHDVRWGSYNGSLGYYAGRTGGSSNFPVNIDTNADYKTTWYGEGNTGANAKGFVTKVGSHTHLFNLYATGGGAEHENRPPFIVLNYIIKVK